MKRFNDSWQVWIEDNVAKQCANEELLAVLVASGFDARESELRLELAEIENKRELAESDTMYAGSEGDFFIPTAVNLSSGKAEIYGVDAFLNDEESLALIDLIRKNLGNVNITGNDSNVSDYAASKSCDLSRLDDAVVNEIERRICNMMGIDSADSEPLLAQWYEADDESVPQVNGFGGDNFQSTLNGAEKNQFTWSFMIYLNSPAEGGHTHFPELNIQVKPNTGNAIIWSNYDQNGELNHVAENTTLPIKRGYKAIVIKRFSSKTLPINFKKESTEYLKPLTRNGFIKMPIPSSIYNPLNDYYLERKHQSTVETVPGFISNSSENTKSSPSTVIDLTDDLRKDTHRKLLPLAEAWAGSFLDPTFVYGIRQYLRGSVLKVHRDRKQTHIVGCILNIDQQVDEDWPLLMEDHHYRQHSVTLKPGEMVFYESGRLPHGRPTPLYGDSFTNVFAHFKIRAG